MPCLRLLLLALLLIRAQPAVDRYEQNLTPALQKLCDRQSLAGLAIGIVEDGRLAYTHGFGLLKLGDSSRPITPQTLFHMASITKPFVATSVMQLWEEGKVDLDSPVIRYVPYFHLKDSRHRAITVRQMLTHTSGMPDVDDYRWNHPEYDDGALERYVRSLSDQSLRWDPGTKFAYSNMAYEVLGDLVSKVSGQTFEDYVRVHILEPLSMSSSTLLWKQADPARLAAGHRRNKVIEFYPYNRAHTPSSNLHSNVVDMARWATANMNRGELDGRRILKASTYDVMWKPAAFQSPQASVGISWFLRELNGQRTVSHSGGDDGFRALLWMIPERKLAIIFMTNCEHADMAAIHSEALQIALAGSR